MPPAAATWSLVMAPAAVHGAWERQTAGDAAADTARQDQTACSHDLLQLSQSDTDWPTSVRRVVGHDKHQLET